MSNWLYRPKVYVASKIYFHTQWKRMRESPDWSHVEFTSRWLDMAHLEDPSAPQPLPADFGHFWTIDIQDVRRSDFVLLFGSDEGLKGALVECGAALGLGKTVIVIDLPEVHSWSFHPLVVRLGTLEAARKFLRHYANLGPQWYEGK